MLRRAALAVAGGGGVAGAYGYKWANDNLGSDALDRIIQVCACLHATLLQIGDALCACGPPQFDKVALPAIIDYKVTEARCEKLPKLLPQLFSEVPEVNRRYANPNPNPNPNPNQVPEAEQLRRYAVLHQKYKQPLFDIFMQLGGAPYASCPRARLCFSAGVVRAAQASTTRAARRSPRTRAAWCPRCTSIGSSPS